MKKYFKYILFAAIIVVFAGTFYFLWKKSRPQEIRYEELSAEIADIKKTTLITGTIEPRDEVNIRATASKYLLPFAYGNAVKTSSLLC